MLLLLLRRAGLLRIHRQAPQRTMSTFIHLHTLDLRVHDSPSLFISHDPSSNLSNQVNHFLPVYIFDERALDVSHLPEGSKPFSPRIRPSEDGRPNGAQQTRAAPTSRVAQFHRTSPHRLWNLLEAVYGLRDTYRRSGGDLLIGYGRPEILIPQLIKTLGEDHVAGVWAQKEYTLEESNMLKNLRKSLPGKVKLQLNDSKTLIPSKHLPFDPAKQTPDVYTAFRKRVEGMGLTLGDNEMLVPPVLTARWSPSKIFNDVRVSVGKKRVNLKSFPDIKLEGKGWIRSGSEYDSMQAMYSALVKPLLDHPPLAGWSSVVKSSDEPPDFHPESALPSEGGSEASALTRLEDYVGHDPKSEEKDGENDNDTDRRDSVWLGGAKAKTYKDTRNGLVGEAFSTKFAGFLALGTLSAREAGWRVGELLQRVGKDAKVRGNVYWILFELLWRDYFQFTTLRYNHKPSSLFDIDGFAASMQDSHEHERPDPNDWHKPNWDDPNDPARRWCEGKTGVPFIDAPMIELRETGYMSNRSRQNVASFLTKDLYVDWRIGAEFFEMHLIDYDTCSNWGNWQYQAGVGNDPRASRQFNPIKQAHDYDADSEYVKLWLPQLEGLPDDIIQTPWLSNKQIKDYPSKPIVENPQWKKFYHKTPGKHSKNKGNGGNGGRGGGGTYRGRSRGTGTGRYGEAHRGPNQ
ncbi:DNA photolyase, FAD-binding/Cryptochrome [Kockovaella imperatae]|uniref:DNA photolyase, FAD-binding/Cryptochrome n=1 Tax=Kockovaella imperatae TaxID=4999 RepID=A0A1Y1UKL7_9TREE|nr:DNA photolyase, FAD-binding/Cryptochrome [Kockovaella imperatae]ORX38588.1 DNA photolyase, FAD-binding/Cryptochrome [Kockovaella imperatae]